MHPSIRRIETLVPKKAAAYGGKARSLATLARAGFPVPAAFAISSEVLDALLKSALPPEDLPERLLVAPARDLTAERLLGIREKLRRAPLPLAVEDAVRRLFETLTNEGADAVAVRSSALREDEDARSAAGLYESVLGIRDEAALFTALREVWSSVYDLRVVSYLRALGVTNRAGLGVIVQALVPADAAGVLFTVNPLSGDAGEMVLNAAYGLGGPVVDGSVSPDTIRIDKASGFVRDRVVGEKARALRFRAATPGDARATYEEVVSGEDAARFVLSDREISALVDLGVRIEALHSLPRFIYILQRDRS